MVNNLDFLHESRTSVGLLTLAFVVWIYWLWGRRHWYRFAWKYPGQFGLPFFGILLHMTNPRNILAYIQELSHKVKHYNYCFWWGSYLVMGTIDPIVIEQILTRPEYLNKANQLYNGVYHGLGRGGLLSIPADRWRRNRKLVSPAFQHKVLISFFDVFNKSQDVIVENFRKLTDGQQHSVEHLIMDIVFDTTLETTLGSFAVEDKQFKKSYAQTLLQLLKYGTIHAILSFFHLGYIMHLYPPYRKDVKMLWDTAEKALYQRTKEIASSSNNNNFFGEIDGQTPKNDNDTINIKKKSMTFIDLMANLFINKKMPERDCISETNTIGAAATETSSTTICLILLMLAMHPDVQEKLYQEILFFHPDKKCHVEYEDLKDLPYLEMVINETMRVISTVPLIGRHVVQDTTLDDGTVLPKGLQIIIPIFHLHRRKDIWGEDAEEFNPDHFLPERIKQIHPYAFIPFSKGLRMCIGYRYSMMFLKVILVGLVRNFQFSTDYKFKDLHFEENITVRLSVHPPLRIQERKE